MTKESTTILNPEFEVNEIEIDFHCLKEEKTPFFTFSGEALVVLLSGELDLNFNSATSFHLGPRENVFNSPPHSAFIPANTPFEMNLNRSSELLIVKSKHPPKSTHLEPTYIPPQKTHTKTVGSGNYKRKVTDIINNQFPADWLLAGETFSLEGKWSSYPPHKHDQHKETHEHQLVEIYFFKVEKTDRFGFINLFCPKKGINKAYRVSNDSLFNIPFGYHPVSAPPDSKLYYFWVLSGPVRELIYQTDPNFL